MFRTGTSGEGERFALKAVVGHPSPAETAGLCKLFSPRAKIFLGVKISSYAVTVVDGSPPSVN